MPEDLWTEVRAIGQEAVIKIICKKKKGKMVVWGGLTNSWAKKRTKRQRKKGKWNGEKAGLKLNIQKIKTMASWSHHLMANRWGNNGTDDWLYILGLQNHSRRWLQLWNSRCLLLARKAMTNLDSILKSRDITLLTRIGLDKAMDFSSRHVWMWELDHKEGWAPKNWCFWTVVLEKTLESSLVSQEIFSVNPKGNQSWIFWSWRWNSNTLATWCENWLLRKDPDAGKDQRQEEKGMTEDEIVRCHYWLDGHEFEQSPGVGDGQGSLACCSPWGHKELDTTEQLNWLTDIP